MLNERIRIDRAAEALRTVALEFWRQPTSASLQEQRKLNRKLLNAAIRYAKAKGYTNETPFSVTETRVGP